MTDHSPQARVTIAAVPDRGDDPTLAPRVARALELKPLLVDKLAFARLLGVSERKLDEMRREGILPDPIDACGPRALRWRYRDIVAWVDAQPAAKAQGEPARLREANELRRAA